MKLVEDLIKNNYLITPPAYYTLAHHYENGSFTLAELVKFAKSRGTFVIDEGTAEEFIKWKGLISSGANGEHESVEEPSVEGMESGTEGAVPQEKELLMGESAGVENSSIEVTAVEESPAVESAPESPEFSNEDVQMEEPLTNGDETLVSNGTWAGSNGDYNGDEGAVKAVYSDYGVLVPLEEEPPEEIGAKSYSVYADFKVTPREGFRPRAAEMPSEARVEFDVRNVKLTPPKVKNAASKEGEIIIRSYELHFRSRLRKLRRILRDTNELTGVVDIGRLSYTAGYEDPVTIIGLVNSKRETRKGFMFELEDATGTVKVFIKRDNPDYSKVWEVLLDSVVAFSGYYSKRGLFFAEHIYLPDVPLYRREKPPLEEPVYAALISDIHVGSDTFCEKAFMKFMKWLNGYTASREEEEILDRLKYLIIAGDVVDGVGIYPGQYNELLIPDIFDQYEALANLLSNVPEHIQVFIGPGNHDAARTALPQPGFYEEYAYPLLKLKNTTIISNPAVLDLHGRKFLIAHGRGIEDIVGNVPNTSHHEPARPMVELLKLRHLAPTFGGKVPVAPDPEDLLVIEEVPDFVQMGHVHVLDYQVYRGVFLLNSATWQAQTEFQKMVNIVPTPAKVPIVDVGTARLKTVVDFSKWCEGM
ncbi:DNA-directed DNA polymerase II small subunit [Palaeococcus ferrophilus]|uniref:DNA-directed DNA polymerase II small subunit n=1 Tax=Palaeococcus ferrophilus TaxID=83868 RepID=UPI00064EB927|nr:DNA-directed DNA polymerase II small subunit [Palaeococcus ferrophilus]